MLVPVSVIPTGSISLDAALGVGGFPRGRVIEVYGPESGGKTTLTLHVIAEAQKMGGQAAFIDAEHALDPVYARKLGVDVDNLLVSQPDNGEQALEIAQALIRSNAVDIVVVDSVAALVPKAELEGDMGDAQMGLQARLMSQALRKLTGDRLEVAHLPDFHQPDPRKDRRDVRQPGNHHRRPRAEILLVDPRGYPPHSVHQGRRPRNRFAHARQSGEEQSGRAVPRSRIRHHLRRRHFAGRRPDRSGRDERLLEKSGTWISYKGERLGQGRENARVFLKEHADIRDKIENELRKALGLSTHVAGSRRETVRRTGKIRSAWLRRLPRAATTVSCWRSDFCPRPAFPKSRGPGGNSLSRVLAQFFALFFLADFACPADQLRRAMRQWKMYLPL